MDISELNSFLTRTIDATEIEMFCSNIENNKGGFDNWFNDQLTVFLNATRTWGSGQRPVKTCYIAYQYELSLTLKMIDKFCDEETKHSYIQKILDRHRENLKYEEENPDTYVSTKKINKSKTKSKQTTLDLDKEAKRVKKEKKETVAERKAREKSIKINALKFKVQ